MFRGLSLQSLNPFHCLRSTGDPSDALPGWMQKYRPVAREWLADARTNTAPPTWSPRCLALGGGQVLEGDTLLLDTLAPHQCGQAQASAQASAWPTLVVMRAPRARDADLAEFVDRVMRQDIGHLLVLGDVDALALRRHAGQRPMQQSALCHGRPTALTQSPATLAAEGWAATLDIDQAPPAWASVGTPAAASPAEAEEPAPAGRTSQPPAAGPRHQRLQLLHVAPAVTGLLDPEELRAVAGWLSAAGGNARVAVVAEERSSEALPQLLAMVGQLLAVLAMQQRHPGHNFCSRRSGHPLDVPLKEALRELHQRHAAYLGGWRHLAAIAAVLQDGAHDMRLSRLGGAGHHRGKAEASNPGFQPDEPAAAASSFDIGQLPPFLANPEVASLRWSRPPVPAPRRLPAGQGPASQA